MVVAVMGKARQTPQNKVKTKRKRHDPQFKDRVALKAVKGIKTVQQIAKGFDVHTAQVSEWKKKRTMQAGSVFENGAVKEQEDFSTELTELYSKIREFTVILDFAVKKSKYLGM
jgi:transposase